MTNFTNYAFIIALSLTVAACSGDSGSSDEGNTGASASGTNSSSTGGDTGNVTDSSAGDNGGTTSAENPGSTTSSGGDNGDAVGLSERAPLGDVDLPIDGAGSGKYELVNAYPNLKFQFAVFVDDVPGENRLVVVEQLGTIQVFDDNPDVATAKKILDIKDNVATASGEQGLLGFAFDPRFTENRFVYTYHNQRGSWESIITRYRWDSATDTLDPASAKVVITVPQEDNGHNGGMIAFGPNDGFLYFALGDGGDGGDPNNHGQNRETLLGSILRIDVNTPDNQGYAVPSSNPFVGQANVEPEIYAYGLRNPWRFSFDRLTGDMWLGDVGQSTYEEINKVVAGGNYGWRIFEGLSIRDINEQAVPGVEYIPPIHQITRDLGQAVIGGYVYRGAIPSLQGRYIYSDFALGTLTALTLNGDTVTSIDVLGKLVQPTSFGETRDGELLVVTSEQGLYKFVETGGAAIEFPPTLSATNLFTDLASLTPISGLIEYQPSHPFWSDGTVKRRWIGVPDDATINFTADDWTFPLGSVSVKHFEFEQVQNSPDSRRRLETRVMYNTRQGWQGFTYRWNAQGTSS